MITINIEYIKSKFDYDLKHDEIIEIYDFINSDEQNAVLNLLSDLTENQWSEAYMDSIKMQAKNIYGEDDYQKLIDNKTIFINSKIADKVVKLKNDDFSIKIYNRLTPLFTDSDKIIPANLSFTGVQRHYPGTGFDYHVDNQGFDGKSDKNVKYTTVLYYNDSYNGGLLDFPHLSVTFKPKARSLVIFNSSEDYLHGVTTVEDGPTRYASTCFIREKK
jgi:hypothetical protein